MRSRRARGVYYTAASLGSTPDPGAGERKRGGRLGVKGGTVSFPVSCGDICVFACRLGYRRIYRGDFKVLFNPRCGRFSDLGYRARGRFTYGLESRVQPELIRTPDLALLSYSRFDGQVSTAAGGVGGAIK